MNGTNLITGFRDGYSLRLANGQRWHIMASDETKPFIDKLTSIMELRTCEPNGYPKLIFIQGELGVELTPPTCSSNVDILEGLPRDGWNVLNLGALKLWSHCDRPDVICEIRTEKNHDLDIIRMWLSLHPIYRRAQNSGGLPMHAALVVRNGKGVLLAAPGETGKSTCCRRLPPPWQALCDDETLIVRVEQNSYAVHPFPTWSEHLLGHSKRTWNVQRKLPLNAIFFLEKSEADVAIPMGQGEAAISIYQSATNICQRSWKNLSQKEERMLKKELFDNACEISSTVSAFKLKVSLKGRFWEEIENVLPRVSQRHISPSKGKSLSEEISTDSINFKILSRRNDCSE
ncbi:MAG: SynChlorMet cassette protein ScmC [Candidatus Aminicenantes bacterium]|nr:SynChlorMet cassette protein ScmC [Candidatus Aminicenantes bacterium]